MAINFVVLFSPMQTEPKCVLIGEIKGSPTIGNTLLLSCHAKDYLYPPGPVVGQKKGIKQSLAICTNTDFSIMKYSLKVSDSEDFRCAKIRRARENSLITSVEFNMPRVTLRVPKNVEYNLWVYLALKSQ